MKIKEILEIIKEKGLGRMAILVGAVGLLLIFAAELIPKDENEPREYESPPSFYEYNQWLENKISGIVNDITGKKGSSVMVTLETGVEYVYATEQTTDNENSENSTDGRFSESGSVEETYITVTDENGRETAVVLAELIPKVRGVSVVCVGGQRAEVQQAVIIAVSTALNISQKDISVSGKGIY